MSIKNDIKELQSINIEIKNLRKRLKELRERSKQIELNIKDFLDNKQINGLKDGDTAILLQTQEKYKIQPKKKITENLRNIVSNFVENASDIDKIISEIENIKKGEVVTNSKLKFQKIKK